MSTGKPYYNLPMNEMFVPWRAPRSYAEQEAYEFKMQQYAQAVFNPLPPPPETPFPSCQKTKAAIPCNPLLLLCN